MFILIMFILSPISKQVQWTLYSPYCVQSTELVCLFIYIGYLTLNIYYYYYVIYNKSKSETNIITHSVPQGSILGPIMFILYINDFSKTSDLLFSILFADDTSVFIECQSYTGVIETLNRN